MIERRRRLGLGFTLLEILAVLAIIGILLAVLIPAVRHARTAAAKCVCLANLKQIGLAMRLYADDFGGWMPEGRLSAFLRLNAIDVGLSKLHPAYCPDIELFFCSALPDRQGELARWRSGNSWVLCGYVYRGTAAPGFSHLEKNADRAVVMGLMRKDRTSGDFPGHDGKSVPILWGDGTVVILPATFAEVNFNPITNPAPFAWADRHKP